MLLNLLYHPAITVFLEASWGISPHKLVCTYYFLCQSASVTKDDLIKWLARVWEGSEAWFIFVESLKAVSILYSQTLALQVRFQCPFVNCNAECSMLASYQGPKSIHRECYLYVSVTQTSWVHFSIYNQAFQGTLLQVQYTVVCCYLC